MTDNESSIHEYEYKAEMKQLLNIIINSLYTNPDIFLIELVSNASDALNKLRFLNLTDSENFPVSSQYQISINLDNENATFSIDDSGIGMTENDLINRIGTIASSGTLGFFKEMNQKDNQIDSNLIGQFGVGFYSVFMVTDKITIETKYAQDRSIALMWESVSEDKYTIKEIERITNGTKIYFKLKDEYKKYSDVNVVKQVLKKYSNFVDFPIYVNGELVNTISALWHRKKGEITDEEANEFYTFISGDTNKTLGFIHFSVEGNINLEALLFIPCHKFSFWLKDEFAKGLQLYSGRIFISDNIEELLPDYLKFVRGVVDTVDLPLNVSREVTQANPLQAKIRNILTNKILSYLEDLAVTNPNKYRQFYDNFGSLFKLGLNSDYYNKERLINLMRYESTFIEKGERTTLKDYVSRMKDNQKEIYYIIGDKRETILENPKLEYFLENNIEVILLNDPSDFISFPYILKYQDKLIQSIEKADLDLSTESKYENSLSQEAIDSIIKLFKEILGDKIENVVPSKRLVESPITLVSSHSGLDSQMEKIIKQIDKDFTLSKKILEVNTSHPLIINLWKMYIANKSNDLINKIIYQLYEGLLIIEGELENPIKYINRTNEILLQTTESIMN